MIVKTDLWEFLYQSKKINKPIRLIELFAGIGSQFKALKVLGANVENYKTCEWAIYSILAYKNIHHSEDKRDFSLGLTKEQLADKLDGISADYNRALTKEEILHRSIYELRNIYNACIINKNLIDISKVSGCDLEIVEKEKYEYIMTYSFPCQDLSSAGLRKGMEDGTRSGLLWQVERILDELRESNQLPQILLMENVPQVIGSRNIKLFQKWEQKLESLGYQNYIDVLDAKDYGIPQRRKRCFIISLLGDFSFKFPIRMPLKYHLVDFLDKEVSDEYILSDKMLAYIISQSSTGGWGKNAIINNKIANTLTTREGQSRCSQSNYYSSLLPINCNLKKLLNKNDIHNDYLIRKLTPLECFKLMGFEKIDAIRSLDVVSKSKMYHLAGDSIVVPVLIAIFGELIDVDYIYIIDNYINSIIK